MKKIQKFNGFTLIELMVVITIIAIMASVAIFGLPAVQRKGQDTQRLAGFRELQLAVEGYKSINGKYPDAGSGSNYIIGLTPGFLNSLPQDSVQSNNQGFQYKVSTDKKSYCLFVAGTVFKPDTQKDLQSDCDNTWMACKGNNIDEVADCSFGNEAPGDDGFDNY